MKLILRHLLRNKSYTLINIMGLSLGITCALILYLMVRYSTGVDKYHQKKDRIYRVVSASQVNERTDYSPGVPIPLPSAFALEFPEAEIVAPVYYRVGGRVMVYSNEGDLADIYEEREGIAFCNEQLYKILDRPWVLGNAEVALQGPGKVVLSEKSAAKYFDEQDPIGRRISIDEVGDLEVTGVIADYPLNQTDFPFDILISFKTFENLQSNLDNWGSTSSDFQCYVLFHDGTDVNTVTSRLPAFADKYYGEDRTDRRVNQLQSLSDLHHNEELSNYSYRTVSRGNILAMIVLGFFLIVTACANFINLATAQAFDRFKEVGIRKVLGGGRDSIVLNYLSETALLTFVAVVIGLGLAELLVFEVNSFLSLSMSLHLTDPNLWIFLLSIWLFVTLAAGLYPSLIISGFTPAASVRGIHGMGRSKSSLLRKGLVIFQFTISQVLIVGTVITLSQLRFLENAPVGFERKGILNITLPENRLSKMQALKTALGNLAGVKGVSLAWGPPAWGGVSTTNLRFKSPSEDKWNETNVQVKMSDKDYLDVYGIDLIAGEGLNDSDTISRLVINESLVREMGFSNPQEAVGTTLRLWGRPWPVTGVVKDFHTMSFRRRIEPVVLYSDAQRYENVAVRFSTSSLSGLLKDLKHSYAAIYEGYEFNYSFIDETFAQFFSGEKKMSKMLVVFSCISVFISCLGLLGLVSFMANKKVKEIGIRKVLGASGASILAMLSKDFVILIFVGFVLAVPMAYFGMGAWLKDFVYRIDMEWWMFFIGIGITVIIALLTISFRALRASIANPVDSLRDE